MYSAPVDHPLDLTTQLVLTAGSYSIVILALIIAIRMGIQQRTPFYLLIILAVGFGAGAPTIIALHLDNPTPLLVGIGTSISILFALTLIYTVAKTVPHLRGTSTVDARHSSQQPGGYRLAE